MIRGFEYINNSHCKVYLPFVNSATENKAKGASHTVTNNGVAIRTLADYSIPDCPNGAKKAAYVGNSDNYLSIPYSTDFEYFGKEPLTVRAWVYIPVLESKLYPILDLFPNTSDYLTIGVLGGGGNGFGGVFAKDMTYTNYIQQNKLIIEGEWTLCEITFFDTRGGNGYVYSYINGFGDISTNGEAKRDTPLNTNLIIMNSESSNFLGCYMSEFQIFKGLARPRPGTYNPTNNQRYYTLPTKML